MSIPKALLLAGFLLLGFSFSAEAQRPDRLIKRSLQSWAENFETPYTTPQYRCTIDKVTVNTARREIHLYMGEFFAGQPFTSASVKRIYQEVKDRLPAAYRNYRLTIYGKKEPIDRLIPNIHSDKPRANRLWGDIHHRGAPWVTPLSRPYRVTAGLQDRHLSVWASHGSYFSEKTNHWRWQRPRLYVTTEDLFTQTIVVPFLYPMLERAGAVVFTPRERDWQPLEVIVDNDAPTQQGKYVEAEGRHAWTSCGTGFAYKSLLVDGENPFRMGTVRGAATQTNKNQSSSITWLPDIVADGRYAVYVSYATVPTSVTDALYTVRHRGQSTRFRVNQKMGGGTWVYLGTFDFEVGHPEDNCVTLSNVSNYRGMVTADAVRFGGGMGNVARCISGDTINGPRTSGLPRYLEGARYSAQWAGMPRTIYSPRMGTNDYADDINVRSYMTNYLASGSAYLPADSGLHVPLELSLGIHSDAGFRPDSTLIGTLGIYTTDYNDGVLAAGLSRFTGRDFNDMMLTQVHRDLAAHFGRWHRRQMYDRNYSESRVPQMPSMILEMLSHQNFADLRMGHDPVFKFVMARSIYKALLRYTALMHGQTDVVVQPLPVQDLATRLDAEAGTLTLSWQPRTDALEPTAKPTGYVVYTRMGNGGYDNGRYCSEAELTLPAQPDLLYSFRVTAVNDGGESMPSEEVCARLATNSRASVLIVNGFTRLAGPQPIERDTLRGFDLLTDPGVPYDRTPAFCGPQSVFSTHNYGLPGEREIGYSDSTWEGRILAGNSFDFIALHARDVAEAGAYSIASCSRSAVEKELVSLNDYHLVDLLMGLQRADGYSLRPVKTFTPALRKALEEYTRLRGNVLVSGAYIGSDMDTPDEQVFTGRVLKYRTGGALCTDSLWALQGMNTEFTLFTRPGEARYPITRSDCLMPVGDGAFSTLLYKSGGYGAAVAYGGPNYRCMALGFPLESIREAGTRKKIVAASLNFLLPR